MKSCFRLFAAALAVITALSCTSVTAFADKLKTVDGVKYRCSESGEQIEKYTGWTKTKSGKRYYYEDGVRVTKNTTINGVRWKFAGNGVCKGKFTGFTWATNENMKYNDEDYQRGQYKSRLFWKNGKLVRNKWVKIGGKYYYFGIDGYQIVDGADEKYKLLEPLSDERKEQILKVYRDKFSLPEPDMIQVQAYFGTYNGYDVVQIGYGDKISFKPDEITFYYCLHTSIILPKTEESHLWLFNGRYLEFIDHVERDKYRENSIDDEDIMHIKYYLQRFLLSEGITTLEVKKEEPEYTAPDPLTDEQKEMLFEDYLKYIEGRGEKWTDEEKADIYIVKNFGTYDGCEAVVISSRELNVTDDMKYIKIGGHTIALSSGSYELLLHRDGTFIPVKTAYERGILTDDDIERMESYSPKRD